MCYSQTGHKDKEHNKNEIVLLANIHNKSYYSINVRSKSKFIWLN